MKRAWALLSAGWIAVYSSMWHASANTWALIERANTLTLDGIDGTWQLLDGGVGTIVIFTIAFIVLGTVLAKIYKII